MLSVIASKFETPPKRPKSLSLCCREHRILNEWIVNLGMTVGLSPMEIG